MTEPFAARMERIRALAAQDVQLGVRFIPPTATDIVIPVYQHYLTPVIDPVCLQSFSRQSVIAAQPMTMAELATAPISGSASMHEPSPSSSAALAARIESRTQRREEAKLAAAVEAARVKAEAVAQRAEEEARRNRRLVAMKADAERRKREKELMRKEILAELQVHNQLLPPAVTAGPVTESQPFSHSPRVNSNRRPEWHAMTVQELEDERRATQQRFKREKRLIDRDELPPPPPPVIGSQRPLARVKSKSSKKQSLKRLNQRMKSMLVTTKRKGIKTRNSTTPASRRRSTVVSLIHHTGAAAVADFFADDRPALTASRFDDNHQSAHSAIHDGHSHTHSLALPLTADELRALIQTELARFLRSGALSPETSQSQSQPSVRHSPTSLTHHQIDELESSILDKLMEEEAINIHRVQRRCRIYREHARDIEDTERELAAIEANEQAIAEKWSSSLREKPDLPAPVPVPTVPAPVTQPTASVTLPSAPLRPVSAYNRAAEEILLSLIGDVSDEIERALDEELEAAAQRILDTHFAQEAPSVSS